MCRRFVTLILALGAWRIYQALTLTLPWAGLAFLLILTGPIAGLAAAQIVHWRPYTNAMFYKARPEEIKPVMAHIQEHWRTGDVVYLYSQSNVAFNRYANDFAFRPGDTIQGMLAEMCLSEWSAVEADLAPLGGRARVWVLFQPCQRGQRCR